MKKAEERINHQIVERIQDQLEQLGAKRARISEPSSSSNERDHADELPPPLVDEDMQDAPGVDHESAEGDQEELKDAVMSIVADEQLAQWLCERLHRRN